MSGPRLPAHLEVSALIRAVEASGGFGTVIVKGERDAGVVLILTTERDGTARLWERMPRLDGGRVFQIVRKQTIDKKSEFDEYLSRRSVGDPDLWLIELDIADPERLIAEFSL